MKLHVNDTEIEPSSLVGDGYWYLGSPYSKYPMGLEAAFEEICRIAGWFIQQGINVYSPIAHTHPIAWNAGMDALDHKIWLPADKPLMDAAKGLIVAEMASWQDSYGLKHEIEEFFMARKPIYNFTP